MVFKKSSISEILGEDKEIINKNIMLLRQREENSENYLFFKTSAKFNPDTGELMENGKEEINFYFERGGGMSYSILNEINTADKARRNIWASMQAFRGVYFRKE